MSENLLRSPINDGLFRKEILEARKFSAFGTIKLSQRKIYMFISIALIFLIIGFFLFLYFGHVTKKSKVVGVVTPVNGSLSLLSNNAGTVIKIYAAEGDKIKKGQALFEIRTEHSTSDGDLFVLIEKQLMLRKSSLISEKEILADQYKSKMQVLKSRIESYAAESEQFDRQIVIARNRQGFGESNFEKYSKLQNNGFISSEQLMQKRGDLLSLDAQIEALIQSKKQVITARLGTEADIVALDGDTNKSLAQIDEQIASINQELIENKNKTVNIISAPESGIFSTLTCKLGQSIKSGQTLATWTPTSKGLNDKDDEIAVELFAPSRSVGFIKNGNQVLIRLQAYPYQKFGFVKGIVDDISQTSIAPTELPDNVSSTILSNSQQALSGTNIYEALYRIKVKLSVQEISAYGALYRLRPGMSVDADIIQDDRKIWEWIAEPILAASKK